MTNKNCSMSQGTLAALVEELIASNKEEVDNTGPLKLPMSKHLL